MEVRESGGAVCRLHERACRKVWECECQDPGFHVATVGRNLNRKTCHGSVVCMTADQLYGKTREQNDARQRLVKKRLLAACMAGSGREEAVRMIAAFELTRKEEVVVEGDSHRMA